MSPIFVVDESDADADEGTYFVDQAGHYYYQAKGETQHVMTMMPTAISGGEEGEFIINQENDDGDDDGDEAVSFICQIFSHDILGFSK